MNSTVLLNILMREAPMLINALKNNSNSFPNIENSIVDAVDYKDLENQYNQAYNHISSDLVPDSTNQNVALSNLNRALGITNPISTETPNVPFTNGDMARQFEDDEMQRKVKLNALYQILQPNK